VAPETGNAGLPTVERLTGGTSRRYEVEDRSIMFRLYRKVHSNNIVTIANKVVDMW